MGRQMTKLSYFGLLLFCLVVLGQQQQQSAAAAANSTPPRQPIESIHQPTQQQHNNNNNKLNISYETRWFRGQLLDHFSWAQERTWSQRYLVNKDHWCGRNCPILFYCGNEGDIEVFTNNTGFMWEHANQLHAMLVFAEHRFYGQSLPFGPMDLRNLSPEDKQHLGYMNSEQALADYANLIHHLRNDIYEAQHSAVIVLGGSYGGMLAAWMRMKYPHLVQGALAASAPILQFPGEYDCKQFNQIVTKDYENYSANCSRSIARSWSILANWARASSSNGTTTTSGATTTRGSNISFLAKTFNICPGQMEYPEDVASLSSILGGIWVNLAMTDYANAATFLSQLPAYPIKHVCQQLRKNPDDLDDRQLVRALALASQVYTNFTGAARCLDLNQFLFDPMDVLWDYQSCTEMVMPICSDGLNDMFPAEPFDLTLYVADCKRRWNVTTQVDKIKYMYGDRRHLNQSASNIIFSTCSRDPWSAGSPQEGDAARQLHAIKIEGVCHHEDLRPSGADDPPQLIKARQLELNIISDWIELHYEQVKKQLNSNETFTTLNHL